jgi:hypothetical protein
LCSAAWSQTVKDGKGDITDIGNVGEENEGAEKGTSLIFAEWARKMSDVPFSCLFKTSGLLAGI